MLAANKELAAEISLDLKKLDQDIEEDSNVENNGDIEVLKEGLMNIALSKVKNSSIVSNKLSESWQARPSRLSSSSLASYQRHKSILADKSLNIPANKTPSTSNKVSPSSTRKSPSNNRSPSSIKVSPVSIKEAHGSNTVSPSSNNISPKSNQSSPKENLFPQNLTDEQQNSSSSQNENEEENKSVVQPRRSRYSESSCSSEASCQSQTNKQTNKTKKKI